MSGRPTAHVSAWADEVTAVGECVVGLLARGKPRRRAGGYILGDNGRVLVVDETGFLPGTRLADVARQYSSAAGEWATG